MLELLYNSKSIMELLEAFALRHSSHVYTLQANVYVQALIYTIR